MLEDCPFSVAIDISFIQAWALNNGNVASIGLTHIMTHLLAFLVHSFVPVYMRCPSSIRAIRLDSAVCFTRLL